MTRDPDDAATKPTSIEKRLAAKAAMTPQTGANLVGLDDFEEAGEELYLIRWYPSVAEAEAAQARRKRQEPDEVTFVYAAEDP